MTDPAKRERAALDVLGSSPNGGQSGRPHTTPEPGDGPRRLGVRTPVAARYPETITGTGEDELAAMI